MVGLESWSLPSLMEPLVFQFSYIYTENWNQGMRWTQLTSLNVINRLIFVTEMQCSPRITNSTFKILLIWMGFGAGLLGGYSYQVLGSTHSPPPIQWVQGLRREADHSPLSGVEVKYASRYILQLSHKSS